MEMNEVSEQNEVKFDVGQWTIAYTINNSAWEAYVLYPTWIRFETNDSQIGLTCTLNYFFFK